MFTILSVATDVVAELKTSPKGLTASTMSMRIGVPESKIQEVLNEFKEDGLIYIENIGSTEYFKISEKGRKPVSTTK